MEREFKESLYSEGSSSLISTDDEICCRHGEGICGNDIIRDSYMCENCVAACVRDQIYQCQTCGVIPMGDIAEYLDGALDLDEYQHRTRTAIYWFLKNGVDLSPMEIYPDLSAIIADVKFIMSARRANGSIQCPIHKECRRI